MTLFTTYEIRFCRERIDPVYRDIGILRFWHIQFLYTCNDFNRSNTLCIGPKLLQILSPIEMEKCGIIGVGDFPSVEWFL